MMFLFAFFGFLLINFKLVKVNNKNYDQKFEVNPLKYHDISLKTLKTRAVFFFKIK